MNATAATAHPRPRSNRPVAWRRVAGVAVGVAAIGGLGAIVHETAEPSHRSAVVAPSSGSADVESIWSALLQLDAAQVATVRAGLSPDVRAAVEELDAKLADREAAIQASPTLGITAMNGAFWAAAPPAGSSLGITEMYGAFWAAFPPRLALDPPMPEGHPGLTSVGP